MAFEVIGVSLDRVQFPDAYEPEWSIVPPYGPGHSGASRAATQSFRRGCVAAFLDLQTDRI